MTSHINSVIKQAIITFSSARELFSQHLERLKVCLDRTSPADLGLAGHDLLKSHFWSHCSKAPVGYVDVYQDNVVSVGVFVLGPGNKLPLHDHPHMHGLIKVLAGKVLIRSYTIHDKVQEGVYEVISHPAVTISHTDPPCYLEPKNKNLHEIESLGEPSAFLDVLSPPYEVHVDDLGPRLCSYFRPIKQIGQDRFWFKVVESPSWYWTEPHKYVGPTIEKCDFPKISFKQ